MPPVNPESVLSGLKRTDELYTYYTAWWAQNRDRVNLFDPWLADLQKQKID